MNRWQILPFQEMYKSHGGLPMGPECSLCTKRLGLSRETFIKNKIIESATRSNWRKLRRKVLEFTNW